MVCVRKKSANIFLTHTRTHTRAHYGTHARFALRIAQQRRKENKKTVLIIFFCVQPSHLSHTTPPRLLSFLAADRYATRRRKADEYARSGSDYVRKEGRCGEEGEEERFEGKTTHRLQKKNTPAEHTTQKLDAILQTGCSLTFIAEGKRARGWEGVGGRRVQKRRAKGFSLAVTRAQKKRKLLLFVCFFLVHPSPPHSFPPPTSLPSLAVHLVCDRSV